MDLSTALIAALALASANPERPVDRPVDPPLGPVLQAPRIAAPLPLPQPTVATLGGLLPVVRDTVIEYDKAYYTRLTIHRWGSYLMLPLFATQFYLGTQLYNGDEDSNKDAHEMVAAGVAGLFAVNTTTGLWNLWTMRKDPNDRKRRYVHATLMLLADAGFVTTGILADEAEDGDGRSSHRAAAITSMVLSTTGWLIMTDLFRKD